MEQRQEELEQPQITIEEYLADVKGRMRKKSMWAIGIGSFLVVAHMILFAFVIHNDLTEPALTWWDLLRSIFFLLGLFAVALGIYSFYESKKLTAEDVIPTREAYEFAQQIQFITPYFTYILLGCIIAVTIVQMVVGGEYSLMFTESNTTIDTAGLVKTLVWNNNEYWRILTSATLHGGLLHLAFNGYALRGFGEMIEYLSNRSQLAIVFVLSIIGGGFLSSLNMNDLPSVGASGGIMGLIGYLAVYGFRRKSQLMPGFLRSMLVNIGFIAAFGLIGYQIIDNLGHLGGLIVGLIYGYLQIPGDINTSPRNVTDVSKYVGFIALGIFISATMFSILLLAISY